MGCDVVHSPVSDISFLSAFPGERELLYPPLTHLKMTDKKPVELESHGAKYTVCEVEPTLGTV